MSAINAKHQFDAQVEQPRMPFTSANNGCTAYLQRFSDAAWCLQGASTFLQSLASSFGAALFTHLPIVKQLMLQPLLAPPPPDAKQATDTLQILKIIGPVVHEHLFPEVLQAIPAVVRGCGHAQHQVRHLSVMCAVELAATHTELVLPVLLRYFSLALDLDIAAM